MFDRIAIIGVGLLGGSLCRSVRRFMAATSILGIGRDAEGLSTALADGSIDVACTLDAADLSDVDLIVIAAPVVTSMGIIRTVLDRTDLRNDAIVMDVGSVKEAPVLLASGHPRGNQFIGCHPMAGSEKTGYKNATADLYSGAAVIITPSTMNAQPDVHKTEMFWEKLGARVYIADPAVHDFIVAYTSHLPHVAACAVMDAYSACLEDSRGISREMTEPFIGRGFRDVTRISSGSPEVWDEIIDLNRENIKDSLREMISGLSAFLEILEKGEPGEVRRYFERVKSLRDGLK